MRKNSIRGIILTCALGYSLVALSVLVVFAVVKVITGYYPSFTFFPLALITFRLSEISEAFLIAPLVVAILMMMLLSKTPINTRIVGGVSLTAYYVLVALILLVGGGEFPCEILILWLPWTFLLGFTSTLIVDRLQRMQRAFDCLFSRSRMYGRAGVKADSQRPIIEAHSPPRERVYT